MKELQTHKSIRKKVEVWGFAPIPFLIFFGIAVFSALGFMADLSWNAFIICLIINGVSFIINKVILSNESFLKNMLNEKFPNEITDLTKNKDGKL
ncbi:hypothetical protein KRE40_18570 [Elizabethkingia meningoseptica]|uniref:hypothetical protein n=1 Tax=Elizabethkingia meningoseptica TaxID=238 RepID=UPI0023B02ECD|nr:hypothetical protein [Elizabethkingia meningoseptica]MDE5510646.1 hypothetical protein [Elizabethkingia meningoseptica]HAY3536863.1 hypothetical protein [Elizabethkingia anophelis]HAY3548979.1 hypothetical protein [Elizabethkingia anophelis]HAY3593767.1 hypothetical protein [Elizabethkingia anophelis]